MVHMPIYREINILGDLAALWKVWRHFLHARYECVHSVTPKAGLITMLAAMAAGIPTRIHTFTGQVWATRRGLSRTVLKALDRLVAACATHVFADSQSQCEFLISQGILARRKIAVLGAGSISGVDTERFRPDPVTRRQARQRLGIKDSDLVFLFVGRIKRDKGIPELLAAFGALRREAPQCYLMLVGPDEDGLLPDQKDAHIHATGFSDQVESHMVAADVICLPSHREGFGTVLIEAAACGIPAIASRIYGVTDAVIDDTTGLLHPSGDSEALKSAMLRMVLDTPLRLRLGEAALQRARRDFDSRQVTAAWVEFYLSRVR
jgi:glycosyltransferase involved in cell wall biosynthesis